MAKDTFYFSHDYNARNDIKIKKLISKHKYRGYGIFWAIIEDLYNNSNALPTDFECIAFDMREDKKVIESIIKDFELFVFDGDTFGSLSVQKRLDERDSKTIKARASANKRWENANALPSQCEPNAIKESKGNEIKESKGNVIADKPPQKKFIRPSLDLLIDFFLKNKSDENQAEKFFNYYESKGWLVGKASMKNWEAAARNWISNQKNYNGINTKLITLGTSDARIKRASQF